MRQIVPLMCDSSVLCYKLPFAQSYLTQSSPKSILKCCNFLELTSGLHLPLKLSKISSKNYVEIMSQSLCASKTRALLDNHIIFYDGGLSQIHRMVEGGKVC